MYILWSIISVSTYPCFNMYFLHYWKPKELLLYGVVQKIFDAKRRFSYSKLLGRLTSQIRMFTFCYMSALPMKYEHFGLFQIRFAPLLYNIIFELFKSICVTCITYKSIMTTCEIITQDLEYFQRSTSISVLLPQLPSSATHSTSIWNTNTINVKGLSQLHLGRGSWWQKRAREFWSMQSIKGCQSGPHEGSGKLGRGCVEGSGLMHGAGGCSDPSIPHPQPPSLHLYCLAPAPRTLSSG